MLEPELDSTIPNQLYGGNLGDVSVLVDRSLSLWNNMKVSSNADFEQCLEDSEWQAIISLLRSSYRQRNSEQCTKAIESLSCPTLTSCSSKRSRSAGMTKSEKWFKDKQLIPTGCQLSAPATPLLIGYPEDWKSWSNKVVLPKVVNQKRYLNSRNNGFWHEDKHASWELDVC